MGFLFKSLAIVAIVAIAYPPINEGVGGSCHAVEAKAFNILSKESDNKLGLFGILGANITTGGMATFYVKKHYASLPPFIGCTVMYWSVLFDEDIVLKTMEGVRRLKET